MLGDVSHCCGCLALHQLGFAQGGAKLKPQVASCGSSSADGGHWVAGCEWLMIDKREWLVLMNDGEWLMINHHESSWMIKPLSIIEDF